MNRWVAESFRLAASPGYLDKLSKVYPVDVSLSREIEPRDKAAITAAFKSGNRKKLILALLDLERFP